MAGPDAEVAPESDPGGGLLADEAANRRLVATVAAGALLTVALMIGVFLLTRGGGDGDPAPAADPAPASVPTGEEPEAGTGPVPLDESALDSLIPELQAFVEQERDLEFLEDVDLELLGDEAYQARARADLEEDLVEGREDLENAAAALRALGIWPEDGDPVEIVSELLTLGSLGYYDTETGEMVIRGTTDTPNLRITLVHELVHALDDQHFELDRPELDDRADEAGLAFSALVEGNAGRIEATYTAGLTDDERAAAMDEQLGYLEGFDATSIPPILLAEQEFVYGAGAEFVTAIVEAGGNAAVDEALERPPTTSEQILEPEAWPDREPVIRVAAPEADGPVVEEAVVGQFLLHVLTGVGGGEDTGPEWDGDNSVLWRDGDRDCLRFAVAGDLDEIESGLGSWAEQAPEADPPAEIDIDRDGDLLVVTSCR